MGVIGKCAAAVTLAVVLAVVAGCEEKMTAENYERIANGMSVSQVKGILGEARPQEVTGTSIGTAGLTERSRSGGDEVTYVWGEEGSKQIIVIFKDGEVAAKRKIGF